MGAGQLAWGNLNALWQRWRGHGKTATLDFHRQTSSGLTPFHAIDAAVERRRLFVLLPFSLVAGLVTYAALPDEPTAQVFVAGSVILIAGLLLALWLRSLDGTRWAAQFLGLWFGFSLLPIHGLAFGTPMLAFPAYGTYDALVGEVLPGEDGAQRVIVSQMTPVADARPVPIRRARVLLPTGVTFAVGDKIRASLRLAPIPGPVLPGAHDGQFHSYFSGVGAYGSVTGTAERLSAAEGVSLPRAIQFVRDSIGNRIATVLSGDTAAIAKAMVVGDQSAISDEVREVMAASGLAHIYSISGLHLSIVAGGIYWLVRLALASTPLLVAWPVKKVAAVAGLVAAFLYLLMAGGADNVPAFRSTLMLALIFGAVLAGRQALTMRNVAIAAIAIILLDPASVFRPSFQLSFAAVVGLIGIYELPRTTPPKGGGSIRRIGTTIGVTAWTSLVAGLATLLFSAYHFQQTAPLGVLGNLLALPVVTLVIMPAGVLSVLAMPLGIDQPFILAMGWGIDRMVDVAILVAGWSEGWTGNPLLASWTLVLGLVALAWFAFLENYWRLLGPAAATVLILIFGFVPRPDILIADTTQAVAIAHGDSMALASGRTGSFAVDVWSDHFQIEIGASHPEARCDSLGCVVTTDNYSVAIIRGAAAFAEDCGRHDVVIARIDPPTFCARTGLVIGPRQLAVGGMHALIWNEGAGRFETRPAIPGGVRPWRIPLR